MPGRKPQPPRLYLRRPRDHRSSCWVVLDRGKEISTGCSPDDRAGAAGFLAAYIARTHQPAIGAHSPGSLAVGDILTYYAKHKRPNTSEIRKLRRFDETLGLIARLIEWWGTKNLNEVKGRTCREYVIWRTSQRLRQAKSGAALDKRVSSPTARRELEVLRAAINFYHAEFTLDAVPKVTLPPKSRPRERWLTRGEAARLLAATLGFVWDQKAARWKRDERTLCAVRRVDQWRRDQPDLPSRAEAIRRLVTSSLLPVGKEKRRSGTSARS